MPELSVFEWEGELVVDSRLVAERLKIEHESFLRTLETYKTEVEKAFGGIRFEIGVPEKPTGNPPRYALLTEDQATVLMSFSRNTPEVIQCKIELVQKFSRAKDLLRLLSPPPTPVLGHTTVYISRLENMRDHRVADTLWATFREGAEVLLFVERELRVPVDQMDLCDGSIGRHWSQFRQDKTWVKPVGSYEHVFRDQRGQQEARAYDVTELPLFKAWLREEYYPFHLPQYLTDKYGKRAVRQIYGEINVATEHILSITEEKRATPKQAALYQQFLASRAILLSLPPSP